MTMGPRLAQILPIINTRSKSRSDILTLGVLITQGAFSHVCKLDGALRACVHEPITALWVELCSCDDLGEFLHIRWLDVYNIEALVLYVEVPEIDAQVITADEGLAITVHRDAVDVVRMSICIRSPWNRCNDRVVVCETGQLQVFRTAEMDPWV